MIHGFSEPTSILDDSDTIVGQVKYQSSAIYGQGKEQVKTRSVTLQGMRSMFAVRLHKRKRHLSSYVPHGMYCKVR